MDFPQADNIIQDLLLQSHIFEQSLLRFSNSYATDVSTTSKNQNAANTNVGSTFSFNETVDNHENIEIQSDQQFVCSKLAQSVPSLLYSINALRDALHVYSHNHERSSEAIPSTGTRSLSGPPTAFLDQTRSSSSCNSRHHFQRLAENPVSRNPLSTVEEDSCPSSHLCTSSHHSSHVEPLRPNNIPPNSLYPFCTAQSSNSSEGAMRVNIPVSSESMNEFLSNVRHVLTMTDIDNPGIRTGAPSNPNLTSVRRPLEECLPVWCEFFRKRKNLLSDEVRESLRKPSFDNWRWDDTDLLCFIRYFFTGEGELDDALHIAHSASIPPDVLDAWLCVVYSRYNAVPFHNFKHAFMVTQMMYTIIREANLSAFLSSLDLFVLIFSAVCHDLDHPGLNNVYQNNAKTSLSICYNTNSPLENHHCAVAFDIIGIPETNVFVGLSDSEMSLARQLSLRCILGTDMAKHTDLVSSFILKFSSVAHSLDESSCSKEKPQLNVSDLKQIFENDEESLSLLLVILLKIADISTEIRPLSVSDRWLSCLLDEFSSQADLERSMGLPVSPSMDKSIVKVADCQCSFLKFGMLPLAEAIVSVIPALTRLVLEPATRQLDYYTLLSQQSDVPKIESSPELNHLSSTSNDTIIPISAKDNSLQYALFDQSDSRSCTSPRNSDFSNVLPLCENPQRQSPEFRLPNMHSESFSASSHSKICPTMFDSTLVSSAGVAEFLPFLSQWPRRPLRRSLGELPWPRTLSSDFVNIVAAKRFLTPNDCFRRSLYLAKYLEENPDSSLQSTEKEDLSPPPTSVSNEDLSVYSPITESCSPR